MRLLKRLARESRERRREGGSGEHPESRQRMQTNPDNPSVAARSGALQAGSGGSAQSRGGADRESHAQRGRSIEATEPGADQPQIAQNLLFSVSTVKAQVGAFAWSIRPHPGRRPRHRVKGDRLQHRLECYFRRNRTLKKSNKTRKTARAGTANTPARPASSPPAITARSTRMGCMWRAWPWMRGVRKFPSSCWIRT